MFGFTYYLIYNRPSFLHVGFTILKSGVVIFDFRFPNKFLWSELYLFNFYLSGNSIAFFNKHIYIILLNPIVLIFGYQQYGTCPPKQDLFGWFICKGFLTVTCWNNGTVRVVSAAARTVHKLFVGDVWVNWYSKGMKMWKLCFSVVHTMRSFTILILVCHVAHAN